MGQTKQPARGLKSLNRAADTLSTLLAQEVRELNARQKAAKRKRRRPRDDEGAEGGHRRAQGSGRAWRRL